MLYKNNITPHRYRLLYKPVGLKTILLTFLNGTTKVHSVFSLRVDDRPLISLGKTLLLVAIIEDTFLVHLIATRSIFFLVVLGINFL